MTEKHGETVDASTVFSDLVAGNERYRGGLEKMEHPNMSDKVREALALPPGQHPKVCVLGCADSRVPPEIIFDQGLGDILSIRIAGNILNDDIIGSMEFACKLTGSKLIVVLGHTKCGAIEGACNNVELGHLTHLLNKIKPAIDMETEISANRNAGNKTFINNVTRNNIHLAVNEIRKQSTLLAEMEKEKLIKIVGGLYDIESGAVTFYE